MRENVIIFTKNVIKIIWRCGIMPRRLFFVNMRNKTGESVRNFTNARNVTFFVPPFFYFSLF